MEEQLIWQAHRVGGVHFGVYVSRIMLTGRRRKSRRGRRRNDGGQATKKQQDLSHVGAKTAGSEMSHHW